MILHTVGKESIQTPTFLAYYKFNIKWIKLTFFAINLHPVFHNGKAKTCFTNSCTNIRSQSKRHIAGI